MTIHSVVRGKITSNSVVAPGALVQVQQHDLSSNDRLGQRANPRFAFGGRALQMDSGHAWSDGYVADIGQTVVKAKRPNVWLDPTLWPEMVEMPIKLPAPIAKENAEAFRTEVAKELDTLVSMARQTIAPENVLGANRAATISPETRSKTPEAIRKLNPTFAVGRGHGDIAIMAARAVKAFRAAYRAALEKWCAGDRSVGFPEGTWWMRVFHAVNIGGSI